jgi:hypothetical protein
MKSNSKKGESKAPVKAGKKDSDPEEPREDGAVAMDKHRDQGKHLHR